MTSVPTDTTAITDITDISGTIATTDTQTHPSSQPSQPSRAASLLHFESLQQPSSSSSPSNPSQPQALGRRRQRSPDDDTDDNDADEVKDGSAEAASGSSAANARTTAQRRPNKRRRRNSMLADGGGTATSNGTLRVVSNGSRVQHRPSPTTANGTHNNVTGTGVGAGAGSGSGSGADGAQSQHQNGKEVAREQPADYWGHDREEVTRILIQTLSDMGYQDAAESVSRASGFDLESETVADFRTAVLQGSWSEAEQLLFGPTEPPSPQDDDGPQTVNGLVLAPGADTNIMRFWLRQQKFLELLEVKETSRALAVLRNELTPLYQDTQKLHFLSSLLMCQSPEDLKAKAEWDGADGESRRILLSELSRWISPSVMLPEHRLADLFEHVKSSQILNCLYHTSATSPSLYSDHYCEKSRFPTEVVRELDRSVGEVWQVRFSHAGDRLASSGSDDSVIIWDVPTFEILFKLDRHINGAGNFAWSPDDTRIVTCGRDRFARVWNATTGNLLRTIDRFDEPVSSCVFTNDGETVIIGTFDKERSLTQWNLDGDKICVWSKKHRTEDLAISPNGHWLVAMDDNSKLHVYNCLTRELEYEFDIKRRPSSIRISEDSRFLLVNSTDGEMHLYDIASRGKPVQKYAGCTGGAYLIRSAFGGANESFVISGSEDGKLAIWHKATGVQIYKLDAHMPRCNAVCWNPSDPCMFASCGDDGKIKIWSNREYKAKLAMAAKAPHSNGTSSARSWRNELTDVS